jgi:WhiB family transcriptional regulator, redox-sensing transcriptional regulator
MIRRELPRPAWGWADSAACRGEDLNLFFGLDGERGPERERRERKAKRICAGCPVRPDCLEYAVSRPEKYGTWGNLNEDERASERRRRLRNADPQPAPALVPAPALAPAEPTPTRVVVKAAGRRYERDAAGKVKFGTGRCPRCECKQNLRMSGVLQTHRVTPGGPECDGSGEWPAQDLEAAS